MRYPAMKTAILTLLAFLPLCLCAQEYDFAKKIGGNTLYFYITSTGGKDGPTVEVTFPADNEEQPWKGFRKPSGQLAIPETVTPDRSRGRHADPEDDDTTIYTVTAIRYFAFAGCDRITLDWELQDSPQWVFDWYVREGFDEQEFGRGSAFMVKSVKENAKSE
jgi:hypothetical protein